MNLPQLPREPIRPELEKPEADKELWQPRWRCFCCYDSGLVQLGLIRLVIPDYDQHRDKWVVCQNPRCEAGTIKRGDWNYDQRFTAGICAELDKRSREDWRRTTESRFEKIQNRVKDTARGMSLRQRDRTPDEDRASTDRHRLVTEEDWGLVAATEAEKNWFAGSEGESGATTP